MTKEIKSRQNIVDHIQNLDTVVLCEFGSKVYGTNLPTSDSDYKGIFIPESRDIILSKAPSTFSHRTNNAGSGIKNSPDDCDLEMYSLYRFMELLSQGQTVALDLIWTPQNQIVKKSSIWDILVNNRKQFMHKKCSAAIGYAKAQAHKYSLRGDRIKALEILIDTLKHDYINNPQAELGYSVDWLRLSELDENILKYINITKEEAPTLPGGHIKYLEVCGKKAGYTSSVKFAYELFKKQLDAYGDRARAAKDNGADWKACYHAVRIANQTVELLETGRITFPRPEAPHLLDIRLGKLHIEKVSEEIEEGIEKIYQAQKISSLPEEMDRQSWEDFVHEIYLEKIIFKGLKK